MKRILLYLVYLLVCGSGLSQTTWKFDGKTLELSNGNLHRIIRLAGDSVSSEGLFLAGWPENYLRGKSPEFRFLLNDQPVSSWSGWTTVSCEPVSDPLQGTGAAWKLKGSGPAEGIELTISYLLYPDLPVVRKWLTFRNRSDADIKLEAVDIEKLFLNMSYVTTWIYHNYARMKHIGPYCGNWDDPVVVIHNTTQRAGLAVGNEAPGVLKRTVYTGDKDAEAGLTHPGQDFPFRKWLKPGETWVTPKTFIALYSGTDDGYDVVNTVVGDFVRKHLGSRISAIKNKPLFVYNTWNPFRTFVNDSLVREVARAASECGIQEFIIDDGWQYNYRSQTSDKGWGGNYGDWLVDRNKFPGGLTSTFDYIKSLGMKPGLWMSIGSATQDAKVFKDHPEWFVLNKAGQTGNLHVPWATDFYTSCFGTEWKNYIKSAILKLVKENGLAYAKLDFAVATSAYIHDPSISGCYAKDHPYHRDHEESFITIYQNVLELFDELHAEAPELFIDCTFETAGKLQLQDYAFAEHAEGNWLSNIEEPFPTGALRMRQLAWWRSPALPAGSLVIGNLPLDSKNLEFDLQSLIGTLPIVLGDPRNLSQEQRTGVKKWADWMVKMQEKYDYMSVRQDLPGFGEPAEGYWDAWARINTDEKNGGIIGVFRQGAVEKSRTVIIKNLDPDRKYEILKAPDELKINMMDGRQLATEGFSVSLDKDYEGCVFEIRSINQ